MADETEYRIPIIADIGELLAGFQEASNAAQEMGEKIASAGDEGKEGLEKLGEGAEEASGKVEELGEKISEHTEKVGKAMSGWTGLLGVLGAGAAGEILEHVAETTIEVGASMRDTAAALNVSVSEARGFNAAMREVGVSGPAAAMALRRIEMDASGGGKALARLGVSIYDVNGHLKSGLVLFQETIEKLNNLADANQKAEAAVTLLGRNGIRLAGVSDEINEAIDRNIEKQKANAVANNELNENSKQLEKTLAELHGEFINATVAVAPMVEAALQGIMNAVHDTRIEVEKLVKALKELGEGKGEEAGKDWGDLLFGQTGRPGSLMDRLGAWFKQQFHEDLSLEKANELERIMREGMEGTRDYSNEVMGSFMRAENAAKDIHQHMLDSADAARQGAHYTIDAETQAEKAKGKWAPPPSHGGGRKGPEALDAEQTANALDAVNQKMDKMAHEYGQLGNEATMVKDTTLASFDELKSEATADYGVMKEKYQEFLEAVQTGSKKAAAEAEKAWAISMAKFQEVFQQAKERAKQDMQEITSVANTMAGEVSGILNSAISGKLNWATELNKVLSKMIDELTKYVFEMVALMIKGNSMSVASQTAAHGNMIGELVGWVAKMLGVKTAGNTADTAQEVAHQTAITTAKTTAQVTQAAVLATGLATQAALMKTSAVTQGTTQAGLAAANTMAALTPIPYVGPAIAAATAPTIFSETMAYAVAEAGFDVPPGTRPLTMLHPREMVLPASLAEGVRSMTNAGAGSGGPGGGNLTQNIHLEAWDGQSVVDMLTPQQWGDCRRDASRDALWDDR